MIQPKNKKMDAQTLIILILIGLASGILGGMVGIGGGIIIVPALVYFLSFSQKMAQGTSLAILLLPIGLLGVIQFYKQGYIDIRFSIIIALAYFGSRLALSMSQESVKKIFAILMLLIALKMLFLDKAKEASHIDTDTTTHPYT
jgi:uncharacterized membrane protein YfcA